MSLKNKILTLTLTGLAGLVSSGCETMNEGDVLAFGLRGIGARPGMTPQQRYSAEILARTAEEQGRGQHELEIARQGRNNITINNNSYGVSNETTKQIKIFTCNSYNDDDNNGKISFPNEFSGIKKEFGSGEMITIVAYPVRGDIELKIFDANGNLIHNLHAKNTLAGVDHEVLYSKSFNSSGSGYYSYSLYENDKIIGHGNFEVK